MNYPMNLALEMTGLIILILMFFNFGNYRYSFRQKSFDDQYFNLALLINMGLLIADMLSWVFNGASWQGARIALGVSNTIYYMLQPLMCLTWMIYCEYKLAEDWQGLTSHLPFYGIFAILAEALVIVNCFKPILFSVSPENIYSRGGIFYTIYTALCLFYAVYSFLRILVKTWRRRGTKHRYSDPLFSLILYPFFPCIGTIMQNMFYGIAIIWTGSVISLLIIYSNLQNAQITTDPLTGLNNRHRFQSYLHYKLNSRRSGLILYLLMIDIDSLKAINDQHGHLSGDETIRTVADLIIHNIPRSDFVARIGGDEFVVIGERNEVAGIDDTINALEAAITAYNQSSAAPYSISLSIGCSTLANGEDKTVDKLLAEADQMMYTQKQLHHTRAASHVNLQ